MLSYRNARVALISSHSVGDWVRSMTTLSSTLSDNNPSDFFFSLRVRIVSVFSFQFEFVDVLILSATFAAWLTIRKLYKYNTANPVRLYFTYRSRCCLVFDVYRERAIGPFRRTSRTSTRRDYFKRLKKKKKNTRDSTSCTASYTQDVYGKICNRLCVANSSPVYENDMFDYYSQAPVWTLQRLLVFGRFHSPSTYFLFIFFFLRPRRVVDKRFDVTIEIVYRSNGGKKNIFPVKRLKKTVFCSPFVNVWFQIWNVFLFISALR